MDSYNFSKSLASEPLIAVCCSSCADGIPSNGSNFFAWLLGLKAPALAKTSFALFGLGDSKFSEYLRIPKKFRAAMIAAGAAEWHGMGDGDENAGGFMKALDAWIPGFISALPSRLEPTVKPALMTPPATPVAPAAPPSSAPAPTTAPAAAAVETVSAAQIKDLVDRAEALAAEGKAVRVCRGVYWVGAVDFTVRDFHGIDLNRGTSYNAYLILGPTPTLVDTVKAPFAEALIASVRALLGGDLSLLRYVVVNHAEYDHAGALPAVMRVCPQAQVVCTAKCRETLIKNYRKVTWPASVVTWQLAAISGMESGADGWKYNVVKTGDTLKLAAGQTLWFMETPMVHWPESTFTYLVEERVLFSMDGFGQHFSSVARFDDELDAAGLAAVYKDAKSYYANILLLFGKPILHALGKLMEQLKAVDKTAEPLIPRVLATAHGIAWRKDTATIVGLYKRWAQHIVLPKVLILYDTMYGSTERMARAVMQGVVDYRDAKTGGRADCTMLLARDAHPTESADAIIDSACIAVGTPCLNSQMLPTVARHLTYLQGLRPEQRTSLAFGSYGWSVSAVSVLAKTLLDMGLSPLSDPLTVQFSPDDAILAKCYEAGSKLAQVAVQKGVPY
jgi:flavorubredoxin